MSKHQCKVIEPVGLTEISDRLGYPRQTAKTWHQRGVLPPAGPGSVSGAPWWDWSAIEGWARETGRLRETAGATPQG